MSEKPLKINMPGFCPNCTKPFSGPFFLKCKCRGNRVNNVWFPRSWTFPQIIEFLGGRAHGPKRAGSPFRPGKK